MRSAETNDPSTVRDQYRTESRLETRRSVWHPAEDGHNPVDAAASAVRTAGPASILEVGCGTGVFAERLVSENATARVIATDQSSRFAELTRARGVQAATADVQDLPFPDDSFDAVVAMWMLYHVPDLRRGLAELRRVLRPSGVFVAATNGDGHLAGLLADAGGGPLLTGFSSENGLRSLEAHFTSVRQEDIATRAVFESHGHAVDYLSTFDPALARILPFWEGSRWYAGATTVFVAS
ncbi:MAG: class I SAM-dependent methyltransferase [Nocardioidaceae bacterium]